jgi:hypothetical protein
MFFIAKGFVQSKELTSPDEATYKTKQLVPRFNVEIQSTGRIHVKRHAGEFRLPYFLVPDKPPMLLGM